MLKIVIGTEVRISLCLTATTTPLTKNAFKDYARIMYNINGIVFYFDITCWEVYRRIVQQVSQCFDKQKDKDIFLLTKKK